MTSPSARGGGGVPYPAPLLRQQKAMAEEVSIEIGGDYTSFGERAEERPTNVPERYRRRPNTEQARKPRTTRRNRDKTGEGQGEATELPSQPQPSDDLQYPKRIDYSDDSDDDDESVDHNYDVDSITESEVDHLT